MLNNKITRFIVTALAALLLSACDRDAAEETATIRPVQFAPVVRETGERLATFSGTAEADFEATLSFRVSGTVLERPVDVGEDVTRGQLLAKLEDQDYIVAVQKAKADLSLAVAQLRNAQADYDRVKSLYENRNASKNELDAARATAESREAQLQAATEQLEAENLRLSYTRLTAPYDCSIAATFAEENENVNAGTPILRVNCGECAEIVVSVPGTMINAVRRGSEVLVKAEAFPGQRFPAVVTEVGVASSTTGVTFPVRAMLLAPCPSVRSGMAADVLFDFATAEAYRYLVVPVLAVGEDRAGNFVFVLEPVEEGIWVAHRRAITLGTPTGSGLSISEGVEEGELVATAGVRRLEDGMLVTLLPATEQ